MGQARFFVDSKTPGFIDIHWRIALKGNRRPTFDFRTFQNFCPNSDNIRVQFHMIIEASKNHIGNVFWRRRDRRVTDTIWVKAKVMIWQAYNFFWEISFSARRANICIRDWSCRSKGNSKIPRSSAQRKSHRTPKRVFKRGLRTNYQVMHQLDHPTIRVLFTNSGWSTWFLSVYWCFSGVKVFLFFSKNSKAILSLSLEQWPL